MSSATFAGEDYAGGLLETITVLPASSIQEAIDTTTPGGRLVFHIFGALGQFERDLIGERTRACLAAAATRGRKGGRKPAVTDDKLRRAREHIAKGLTVREAAVRVKSSFPPELEAVTTLSGSPPCSIRRSRST